MAVPTVSTWDAILKENYSEAMVQERLAVLSPTWSRLRKDERFFGKRKIVPWIYGTNPGVAPTIANAQTLIGGILSVDAIIARKSLFGVVRLDRELEEVAVKDKYAFLEAADVEWKKTQEWMVQSFAQQLHGSAGGYVGQIAATSTVTTWAITLSNAADAKNFKTGMQVGLSANPGTGSLRGSPSYVTLGPVDRSAGILYTAASTTHWDDVISGAAASDYIFPLGYHAATAHGFESYNPATAPTTGDAVFTCDRSLDPVLLSGYRASASGGTMVDSIINFLLAAADLGFDYDFVEMTPAMGATLISEMSSKVIYDRTKSMEGKMGASSLQIMVPTRKGVIDVVLDPYATSNVGRFIREDGLYIHSAKGCPHLQTQPNSGDIAFPVATENQIEMRLASYWNLVVTDPTCLGRLAF